MHKRILMLLFVVLLAPLTVAQYEENIREDIFIVRPENEFIVESAIPSFLENEDLTFFACIESDGVPLRLSVLCLDTFEFEDIPAVPWGDDNCFIGSTNLEHLGCTKAQLQAEYVIDGENLKLTREIRINKFSKTLNRIVETQFTDGGWQTPLDTAYGVFVLNRFPDIFTERIERAVEYLKLNRNEEDKCWPKDDCRISTTASILFLLDKAGFEDLRVQRDGQLYLEKLQNYLPSGTNWTVEIQDHPVNINNSINTTCVFDYDAIELINLSKNPWVHTESLQPTYETSISVVCTEPVIVTLINQFSETLLTYQGDNFTHEIPPACWTLNNENITCDDRATLFAVNTPIKSQQRTAARSYLSNQLIEDRTAGKHFTSNWSNFNDALYYHDGLTDADDVETALLYQQSNAGRWRDNESFYEYTFYEVGEQELAEAESKILDNVTQDIVTTGYAVMALLENGFSRDDEPLLDAERWVSLMEDETGLNYTDEDLTDPELVEEFNGNRSLIINNTKRNAMAFHVLENNARPLIRTQPRVLVLNEPEMELDIINPTIFELEELTYDIAPALDTVISVEEKDYVGAYSFRRITVSIIDETVEEAFGYVRINLGDNTFVKVPVIVESAPRLNISLPGQITVFGSTTVLPFTVDKTTHNFNCVLEWETEGISSSSTFDINTLNGTTTYNFPVRFARLETENVVYQGTITCTSNGVTFVIPYATNIVRFSSKPLQVQPTILSLNSSMAPYIITVKNLLDQGIDVRAELTQNDPYLLISDPILSLFPGEERNVTIQAIPPEGENYSASNSVVFSSFNIEERVLLDVEILHESQANVPIWILSLIIGLILIAVGSAGYIIYRYRDELLAWYNTKFKKEDIRAKVQSEVQEIEREEELIAIKNMIRILKLQGMSDPDVRKRLLDEGYKSEDVSAALAFTEKKPEDKKAPEKPQEGKK